MAFTVDDYADLLRLLDENPEWKESLRRRVLDEEFLNLPALVRQNSVDIAANTAAIDRLEQSIARLEVAVDKLVRGQAQIFGRLGSAEGQLAEDRWYRHFEGRFGGIVRRARIVTTRDLPLFERAEEERVITQDEARAVRALDLMIDGVRGLPPDAKPVLLAVEISNRIEPGDVARALARAATLSKAGYNGVPVVAGSLIDDGLLDLARRQGIEVLVRPQDIERPAVDFDF
jgi:hypothetical protein